MPNEPNTQDLELTPEELDVAAGGLSKVGAGQLILPAANTYTGTTTVQSGLIGLL